MDALRHTKEHMPAVLSMPSLAVDSDIQIRALEETCCLADKDICQGLPLQTRHSVKASSEHPTMVHTSCCARNLVARSAGLGI